MAKRLWVFGCSFSKPFNEYMLVNNEDSTYNKYKKFMGGTFPPTWSELLAKKMGYELMNCAYGGSSNYRIINKFNTNCHKIEEGDIVIVQWTRNERFYALEHKEDELVEILNQYKSAGIKSILALRGDPTGGPRAEWTSTPGGLNHSDELVKLVSEVGGFEIGVAAFPDGHPASGGNFQQDIDVLLRKEELGATFATTQFFFEASHYFNLISELNRCGSNLEVIPGVMPITNVKQLKRMAELSGTNIPEPIIKTFSENLDPEEVFKLGVEWATNFSAELMEGGAPGLHFYALNAAKATIQIANNLGLATVV